MLSWMLATPIRRIGKPHCWRRAVACWTIIANIGPHTTQLGLAVAGCQHRNRRVIGVQLASAHDVAVQGFHRRLQQATATADPVRQGRNLQLHSFAGIHLRLAIQWLMVTVLGNQNMSQQTGPGQAALDRTARSRCLHDALAARTAELGPHIADHLKASRHPLQQFRDVLAQRAQPPATGANLF